MTPKAKFTRSDAARLLTPRLVREGVWRRACGGPVEDTVHKIVDVLVYLLCKYPIVPHWLFVETVREAVSQIVEEDGELKEIPISEGMATQLIEQAQQQTGLFGSARPEGAKTNLLYFFTEEQKAKLMRIRRVEALGYALSLEQARNPDDPKAGWTKENQEWFQHPDELIDRKDDMWEKTMVKLNKLLRAITFSIALATAAALTTMAVMTVVSVEVAAAGDLSGVSR